MRRATNHKKSEAGNANGVLGATFPFHAWKDFERPLLRCRAPIHYKLAVPNSAETTPLRVWNYTRLVDFLLAFAEHKRQTQRAWSMGVWARDLKVSNVATLTRVVNGERKVGPALSDKFIAYFRFDQREAEYFHHLALAEKNADDTLLKGYAQARLRMLREDREPKIASPEDAKPVFHMQSKRLLALWGTIDVATFNRALAAEDLEALDNRERGLSGISVALYDDSSVGAFGEVFFCVLAKRRGAKLDRAGFYHHLLYADQATVTTYAAMVWGNIHRPAVIEIGTGQRFPISAKMTTDGVTAFELAMSPDLLVSAPEQAMPNVYGISNQPHYHSRFLSTSTMVGVKRLFDPAQDTFRMQPSAFSEFVERMDFRPYSWASYDKVDCDVFAPTEF